MKKQTKFSLCIICIGILGFTSLIYWGCTKTSNFQTSKIHNAKSLPMTWNGEGRNLQRMSVSGEDPCFEHGGTVGFGSTWEMATCKSDCSKGIGFRCGRETHIKCSDGTKIPTGQSGSNCPVTSFSERAMTANFEFLEGGYLKLIFQNAITEEEADNNIFEVEEDDVIEIPQGLLIDGIQYSGFVTLSGNYEINREDGEYGSVTIRITFQE